jgi:hypothetical protein
MASLQPRDDRLDSVDVRQHWFERPNMFPQNTRESAVRREEFHQALQSWLDDSFDDRIGDPDSHGGLAWFWVRHGGDHFYLNADSTRAGVRQYLRIVERSGGDADWSMHSSTPGIRDRVAVGADREIVDGFEFYRHVPTR